MPLPTEDHKALTKRFNINDRDTVVDIGGGHTPFSYADIIVDIDFDCGMHRDGHKIGEIKPGQQYIMADAAALPFKDKSFDFLLCVHVLEHVQDPAMVCRELMRVAKRGFIETPRKWTEYYAGHPSHKWLVNDISGVLTFEPIHYDNSPFFNFALPLVWQEEMLQERVLGNFRNIPCVQFVWDKAFSFKVLGEAPVIDKKRLARRYYNFSFNLLYGMAPPEKVAFHAKMAVNLVPDNLLFRSFYAFTLAVTGEIKQAREQGAGWAIFVKAFLFTICRVLSYVCTSRLKKFVRSFSGRGAESDC